MSTRTEQDRRALAKRAADAIGKLPNVHSVGLGGRERANRPTGEFVIKVFVSSKRPLSDLSPSERVPSEFEGIGVDVVECPLSAPDQGTQHPPGALAGVETDGDRYRPLRGGVQLSGASKDTSYGTLGFIAITDEPSGRRVFAVTNFHVLFDLAHPEQPNISVGQPDTVGSTCCSGIFGKFRFGHRDLEVDAAVVELDPGTEYLAEVEQIGVLSGNTHTITEAEAVSLSYPVRKRGVRTRLTGGTVQGINVVDTTGAGPGGRPYLNGIRVRPNPDPSQPGAFVRWSDHGDSGSAVVNDANDVVALHFAGSSGAGQAGWGTEFPVTDLFQKFVTADALDLRVATASEPGHVFKVAGAAPMPVASLGVAPEIDIELGRSVQGRLLTRLWRQHGGDATRLINSNRHAAALWHLNQGPAVVNALMRARLNRGKPLPHEFEGKDVDACVRNILEMLAKYGEEGLRQAAMSYRALFPNLAGRSYEQILRGLDVSPVESRPDLS